MATTTTTATRVAARAVHATKIYGAGSTQVRALDGVTVELAGGGFTAVMGPSGSGKSTLMHCVAGLDTLTSGQVGCRRPWPPASPPSPRLPASCRWVLVAAAVAGVLAGLGPARRAARLDVLGAISAP